MNNPDATVQPRLDNPTPNSSFGTITDYYRSTTNYLADKNVLIITLVLLLVLSLLGINLLTMLGQGIQYIVNWIGPYVKSLFFNVTDTTGAVINKTSEVLADGTKIGVDIADGSVHSIGNIMRNSDNINPNLGKNMILDNVVNLGVPQTNTSIPLNPNIGIGQPINIQTVPVPVPTPVPVPVPTPVNVPTPVPVYTPAPNLDEVLNKASQNNNSPKPDDTTNPIQNPITSNKNGWCFVGEYEGKRGCIKVGDQDKCMSGQVYPTEKDCLIVN